MTTIRFVILYGMVTISAGSAYVVHLALRNQNVALGYEAERARSESARLRSQINQYRLAPDGHCPDCGAAVAGRFEARAGNFGRKRIPIAIGMA